MWRREVFFNDEMIKCLMAQIKANDISGTKTCTFLYSLLVTSVYTVRLPFLKTALFTDAFLCKW